MSTLGKILLTMVAAPLVFFAVALGGVLLVVALAVLAGIFLMASVFRGPQGRGSTSTTTFRFGHGRMHAAGRRPMAGFQEEADGGRVGRGRAETDLTLDEGVRWETVEDEDDNDSDNDGEGGECMACMGVGADEDGNACPTCGGEGRTER